MSSVNSNSKSVVNIKGKKNSIQTLINFGTVILFVIIVVVIYKYVILNDYQRLRVDGFIGNDDSVTFNNDTIYEKSITDIYRNNNKRADELSNLAIPL